jgi:hypothetical protein
MTIGIAKCSWCGEKIATVNGMLQGHLAKGKKVPCPNSFMDATPEEIAEG